MLVLGLGMWMMSGGMKGYGDLNDAGRELLSFLSTNEATVCNSWFRKRDIHKQTWQHPKSRNWHCIDDVIMRQAKEEVSGCLGDAWNRL